MNKDNPRSAPGLGETLMRTHSVPLQMVGFIGSYYKSKVSQLNLESIKLAKEICDLDPEPPTSHQEPDAFRHAYSFAKLAA